ncbi:hypothetical protein MITSMUL_04817 [Mitsuokella multacida DSM 20544]|uniref:Uncharacterized protein n=1 Tax=Mitsuokella multacida DSM 20544 TaxID=500635 RepID=C9KN07_9FIRM|nr:hypothetical protein MITSMUL_04817 [Mitsuokella multacida DSM 20544]
MFPPPEIHVLILYYLIYNAILANACWKDNGAVLQGTGERAILRSLRSFIKDVIV